MEEEKMGGWRRTLGDVAEFQCFVCKDAGDVRVCDFRNCLKSYHPACVGKEDDFIDSTDQYVCDWHKCAKCRNDALYLCLCCPSSSTCGDCFGKIDFVPVKQSKEFSMGFCRSCFNMAVATEKDDHEEAMVVFGGTPENYKILFKDYWTVLNDKEHFTLLDLQTANIRHKRSLKCKEGNDLDEYHKPLGGNDGAGPSSLSDTMDKPNEVQATLKRKKLEKKTYVGWGSKELTEFLSCIGKDTSTPLDHFKVTEVVKEYVRQKNLHDKKKKSVMCDGNLHSLFNKRKFKYNMIHSLLETHLSANAISEDESDGSVDDNGYTVKKKPRNSLEPKIPKSVSGIDPIIPKSVSGINKKCLAALNPNNLNLIYLRRTLVVKLLTELDTFEQKVIGCLVRVKNDLKSYTYQMTKKYYQIGLVTGIKKSSEEYKIKDTRTDVLLCVSSMWDDVKISMLSEEDFEEDECNDLLSAKKELFKRPTVAELEEKEASVHADIVNHWFDKELQKLGKELERAREKGWRQDIHDLTCKKMLLSTPEERQRRLEAIPEVIPDAEEESKETEIESAPSNPFQGNRDDRQRRVEAIPEVIPDVEEENKETEIESAARNPFQGNREMTGMWLLNANIDSKHRAAICYERKLEPLVTRTAREDWRIHPGWVDRLKWAGLLPFTRLVEATDTSRRLAIDASLLTCLVDRWRPETHTFHFRWGEMAPTLEDVSLLLGLPLAGHAIGPLEAPAGWELSIGQRFEGVYDGVPALASEHHGPKYDWLLHFQIQKFPGYPMVPLNATQITRSLEAYLLWLLGKVMFTENHVTTISACYIPIALEIARAEAPDQITQRSWGSAVLAATYRGMCNGCQLTTSSAALLGCPLFVQLWSWERFSIGRPDVRVDEPMGHLFDADGIDMPTFGLCWTRRKRRYASDQTRRAYRALNEQFDAYTGVIWQPYTEAAINARFPGGMSELCTRDRDYWMTKSKIIFDVFVEEMAQQRVMRQFGLQQLEQPPPIENPLPGPIHRITRKGISRTATQWLLRLQPYVTEWETASTHLWHENVGFDLDEFDRYLQRYMSGTRLRIVQHSHPDEISAPTTSDMYPSYDMSGSRQYAAELTHGLHEEMASFGRSLSQGPLLQHRPQLQPWVTRMQHRIRAVYEAITCTRRSDVVHRHHQQQPRPSMHRHQPRPRLAHQPTTRPPPPDQAGSSAWQHPQQQGPSSSFVFQPQPAGAYGYQPPMFGHEESMSGSAWGSDQDPQENIQDYMSQHTQWMDMYSTPPPGHTQDTQYDQDGSEIHPRNIRVPHRYGWSTPEAPPERHGRRRQ